MAIYHLSATIVQRSKGHSAVAGAAYRSGTRLVDRGTGETHDYGRKRGIVQSEIIAPRHAPQWVFDREELWNRAEFAERRKDSQPAREIRLALPCELTDEQRASLVFDFARDNFAARGMVADISIHRADRHGDERNHHAHIMLTMRELDGDHFAFRKQRDWNKEETLEEWREQWEVCQNRALEAVGSDERVDHRTLEAQGIDREPTHHLGKEANAIERVGKRSRIGDENREVMAHNRELDELVNELAALDAEIAEELAKEFSHTELDIEDLRWEQERADGSRKEIELVSESVALSKTQEPELLKVKEETPADPSSAFTSPITRAYREYVETQEEAEGKAERRWYEEFYNRTVETVQSYWAKFKDKIVSWREGQDREIEGPER